MIENWQRWPGGRGARGKALNNSVAAPAGFMRREVDPLERRVLTPKWPAPLATYFLISEYLWSIFYISNFPLRAHEKAAHLPTFSAGPIIANLLFALVYHSI